MKAHQDLDRSKRFTKANEIVSIISRIAAAVFGGYGFTWGFTALSTALLTLVMLKSEAVITATMLGFIIYLIAVIWAFSARRILVVWLILAGGGALMTQLAFYLPRP